MAAQRDRKAYQADYYRRNKDRLNARKAARRLTLRAAKGGAAAKGAANQSKLTGAAAAKAIADWSAGKLVVSTSPKQGDSFRHAGRCAGRTGGPPWSA